ncbi:MAG: RNA-processing protein [Euryarchaeota archaeon]|nr:RNA-processing protein [Euryarchaeota archaeon]
MFVKVGQERLAVLIGRQGETRQAIEGLGRATLEIDTENGSVEVRSGDSLAELRAGEVVKAIARGFSPERALTMLRNEDLLLEVIEIPARNPNDLRRVTSRLIGSGGRTRAILEELSETSVSVYGKTVSLIGLPEHLGVAREALEMLFDGSPHPVVYAFLERKHKELRQR